MRLASLGLPPSASYTVYEYEGKQSMQHQDTVPHLQQKIDLTARIFTAAWASWFAVLNFTPGKFAFFRDLAPQLTPRGIAF